MSTPKLDPARSLLRCQKGFTLIEIISVLVIISVIVAIGFKRLEAVSYTASVKVLEHAVSELNSRELISWAIIKCSDQGWITDDALFAQLDKNIGYGYQWASAATATGGTLQMQSATISLSCPQLKCTGRHEYHVQCLQS